MVMTILISPKKLISTKIMDHIDSPKKKKKIILVQKFFIQFYYKEKRVSNKNLHSVTRS